MKNKEEPKKTAWEYDGEPKKTAWESEGVPKETPLETEGETNNLALTQFVEGTTLHGLNHVCTSDTRRGRRILWLCLLLAMLGSFVLMTVGSVLRYYRYESATKIERVSVSELDLPAISICPRTKIAVSTLTTDPEALYWMREFVQNLDQLNATAIEDGRRVLRRHNMVWTMFVHLPRMIRNCTVNGDFDCQHLFDYILSDKGICLTLQSNDIVEQYGTLRTRNPGTAYGFHMWIDVADNDTLVRNTDGSGIRVVVHDTQMPPRTDEQSVLIPPGTEAALRIEKHVIKSLGKPYSNVNCVQDVTPHKYKTGLRYKRYSYEGCMADCMVQHVTDGCNCTLTFDNVTGCTLDHFMFCLQPYYAGYYAHCQHCLYPCTDTRYSADLTALTLPGYGTDSLFQYNTTEDIRNNLILLHVYHPSLHYTVTAQVASFTIDSLVSNIGGQVGLFLGASLLTFFELIEGLGFIAWTAYQRKTHKKNTVESLPEKS